MFQHVEIIANYYLYLPDFDLASIAFCYFNEENLDLRWTRVEGIKIIYL